MKRHDKNLREKRLLQAKISCIILRIKKRQEYNDLE